MKIMFYSKTKTVWKNPTIIEPVAKYQAKPPTHRKYKYFGNYSTIGAAVEAMYKDAGEDPRINTPLDQAFSVMNLGITPMQRAAFNDFKGQLYLEADYIQDICWTMLEHVT